MVYIYCNVDFFFIIVDLMSLWLEEECRNFENGFRIYGKDFYFI